MLASTIALGLVAFAAVTIGGGGTARALPRLPMDIADDLPGAPRPACSVCHWEGKVGGITTITPFVLALKTHGFDGGNRASLATALSRLDTEGTDSDGDGVTDVDELRAGTDPNSPVPQAATADPSYGCTVMGSTPASWGWWAMLGILWSLSRRRVR